MSIYDLEERTLRFAQDVRTFVRQYPKTIDSMEDLKQLLRASGSVGANYVEANEALSKKDFLFRIKLCRKEAKEARYWLRLLDAEHDGQALARKVLLQEAVELLKIFASIAKKSG